MNNFPFIKQHDAMECGVACLAMVCNFFRIEYSIEYLSRICFATTEGVSLLGINETALQLGLRTISGRISINKLWEAHYPCILHWNQNHFVVLYKIKKNRFYIADPAKGLVKYNLEEFKKHWVSIQSGGEEKGIAMFLEPTPAFYEKKTDEQPTEERSFKFLFGYIKQYRKYYNAINFNGDVIKCTACNDLYENKTHGIIQKDGSISWDMDFIRKYEVKSFENKRCLQCKQLPICMGVCPRDNEYVNACKFDRMDINLEDSMVNYIDSMCK